MSLNMTTEKFSYKEKLRNTQKHKDIKTFKHSSAIQYKCHFIRYLLTSKVR